MRITPWGMPTFCLKSKCQIPWPSSKLSENASEKTIIMLQYKKKRIMLQDVISTSSSSDLHFQWMVFRNSFHLHFRPFCEDRPARTTLRKPSRGTPNEDQLSANPTLTLCQPCAEPCANLVPSMAVVFWKRRFRQIRNSIIQKILSERGLWK